MRICFVHQYFPGQFKRLARHFVDEGHDVIAFHRGLTDGRSSSQIDGVRLIKYGQKLAEQPETGALDAVEWFIRESADLATIAEELRVEESWRPDIVYSHTGWGRAAYLHDVFTRAKHVKYCEWFYNNRASSTEFLHPGGRALPYRMATSTLNLPILGDIVAAHQLIAPTEWQKAQFPLAMRNNIEVVPDGIDMEFFKPRPDAAFALPDGRTLSRKDRIVTYATRGADPFRGFGQFIEALGRLQARDPQVEAIILGDRKIYYGAGHGSETHFDEVIAKAEIDPARTHFLGKLDYEAYRDVLQVSSAHVYLTVPFVLSWSFLEAMATGCAVIGSDTAPIAEFVIDGENGLLANFFDTEELTERIAEMLDAGPRAEAMRLKARETIQQRWSSEIAIAHHMAIVDRLLSTGT
jgi:glycosyltransferase involved in cell wall biosynthesis